ncbi:MAG TPA: phenylalanine--tRNA ligase subunit beta, partial [Gemmatimonadales bacterium]|nr:phenylalanine--tRNA ligase subunit beta [Gemmatimonadales bacterium]
MKVSRRWLEAFLGRTLETRELTEKLAMLGAPVDGIEPIHGELKDIVVALVEDVKPHPNADRLRLCLVNDGSAERHHVVCGAPNVTAGVKYPFARVGSTLPGGLKIEKRKIRGEASEGMLCSARELGLGQDHDGILALDLPDTPLGTPFLDAYPVDDERIEIDVSPNRPDLLGHKGVARELAHRYEVQFRLPALPSPDPEIPPAVREGEEDGRTGGVLVGIEDRTGCGRFVGAVVRGVKVGPSPEWLARRLSSVGLRPINNVVDATNYAMLELGQPMHAYDLATLKGARIVARDARAGETVVTLDGVERKLAPGMTVIADAERVVGIAGVMGGRDTEVSDTTTDVFLECAWFQPSRIRATRRALNITTDASFRFERGVDKWNGPDALRRCLNVMLRAAGGSVDEAPVDVWPEPGNRTRIFLRLSRVAQVLGIDLPLHVVEKTLTAIGCTVVSKPEDGRIAVEVPGWRPDLKAEIDLVEEVGRVYGFEKIPDELRPYRPGNQVDAPSEVAADRVRRGLVNQGLVETITLSMGPADPQGAVAIANPLSAEHGFLRRRLLPGLIREVERNWNAHTRDVRLFEIGTVFTPAGPGERPIETQHVAVVLTGARAPSHWTDGGKAPDLDIWDLKGIIDATAQLANADASVHTASGSWAVGAVGAVEAVRAVEAVVHAGLLVADAPKWAAPLFGLELEIVPGAAPAVRYHLIPSTQASERDLALLVPENVTAADVLAAAKKAGGQLLEQVKVIDEYRGK